MIFDLVAHRVVLTVAGNTGFAYPVLLGHFPWRQFRFKPSTVSAKFAAVIHSFPFHTHHSIRVALDVVECRFRCAPDEVARRRYSYSLGYAPLPACPVPVLVLCCGSLAALYGSLSALHVLHLHRPDGHGYRHANPR